MLLFSFHAGSITALLKEKVMGQFFQKRRLTIVQAMIENQMPAIIRIE